jgi:glucose-6-phosphate isomerase
MSYVSHLIDNAKPDIRSLRDLKEVLYDQEWARGAGNFSVYFMYRDLSVNEKDKQKIISNDLRYDITVIPSKMLGMEFPKTYGHEHAPVSGTREMTYPEIYEVLEGEAYFLLQKQKMGAIDDLRVVQAKQGEKCIIPPNYGHVTVNASGRELKMANWMERDSKSDYSIFTSKRGAGYYAVSSETTPGADSSINWVINDNYPVVPELKIYQAKEFNSIFERFGINPSEPMYNLVNNIRTLNLLKNPQKYSWDKLQTIHFKS